MTKSIYIQCLLVYFLINLVFCANAQKHIGYFKNEERHLEPVKMSVTDSTSLLYVNDSIRGYRVKILFRTNLEIPENSTTNIDKGLIDNVEKSEGIYFSVNDIELTRIYHLLPDHENLLPSKAMFVHKKESDYIIIQNDLISFIGSNYYSNVVVRVSKNHNIDQADVFVVETNKKISGSSFKLNKFKQLH